MTQTLTATRISLGLEHDDCRHFAAPLHLQLANGGYQDCSVMGVPETVQEWRAGHRTARKRADRAVRLGYRFDQIKRENHADDIYAINTSLDERQGRPMTASYRQPVSLDPLPDYPCQQHRISTYGVLWGDALVAYLWLYRSGELALVSSILGHGGHLANDIMFLLFHGVLERETGQGGLLVYNRHDSGTDGLRYFKARLGFRETRVEWLP